MSAKNRVRAVALTVLTAVFAAGAGCNAVKGLGQDISESAEGVDKAVFDKDEKKE